MTADIFAVLAEPRRRQILDRLRTGPQSVNALARQFGWSQPAVSKHLKVLRDHGLVTSRTAAQHRIYRLDAASLHELDDWLQPYRTLWATSLDALAVHLDERAMHPPTTEPEPRDLP